MSALGASGRSSTTSSNSADAALGAPSESECTPPVLDLAADGCGTEQSSRALRGVPHYVARVDSSAELLAAADSRAGVEYRPARAKAPTYDPSSPDASETRMALRDLIARVEIGGDGGAFVLVGGGPPEPLPTGLDDPEGRDPTSIQEPAATNQSRSTSAPRALPGARPLGQRPGSRICMVGATLRLADSLGAVSAGFEPTRSPLAVRKADPIGNASCRRATRASGA